MGAPSIDTLFNVYDIMSSSVDPTTNTLTCQLGNAITGDVYSDGGEFWGPAGLASLPSNYQKNAQDAPQSISITRSDREIVIAQRYIPGQSIYGTNFSPGDTCLYANGPDGKGQARVLLKGDTGAINLYTTKDNAPGGTGMGLFIAPKSDTIQLINSQGYGIIIDTDGVKIIAGSSAGIQVLASGDIKSIATGQNQIDGGSILLGSIGVPLVMSALVGPVGVAGVPSTKTVIQL